MPKQWSGLSGGLNTYAYAGSNPIAHADSTGLVITEVARCVFGGIAGYVAADGFKAAAKEFQQRQKQRQEDLAKRSNADCPEAEDRAETHRNLVDANGIIADASASFSDQAASGVASVALAAAGVSKFGNPLCAIVGAGLGAKYGDGSTARWIDKTYGDIADFLGGD